MKRLIWASIALLFHACSVNQNDYAVRGLNGNSDVSVPLAFGNLSINDLLSKKDSAYIKVQPDSLIYLSYTQSLASQDIRSLISFPNIPNSGSINAYMTIPAGVYPPAPSDITVANSSQPVNMGITPEALTEIGLKSGTLSYNLSVSPANASLSYAVLIAIPEFTTAGGGTFSQEVTGKGSIPLANYIFKSATSNTFHLNLSLIIKKSSSTVVIPPGTTATVGISFAGMDFTYIKGFFGDQTVTTPAQTLNLQAFGTSLIHGATVSFAQPSVSLTVVSDYGVPLQVNFLALQAQKPGSSLSMVTAPASPININQPLVLGTSATTSVSVTNASALLNFAPTQFYYQVSGHINKGLSAGADFMADTSKMRVNLNVKVPLFGKASNIILLDTVATGLGDLKETTVASASLKTLITNQLPLDATVQFYLADANSKILDSLLTTSQTNLVRGSTVNATGDLQAPGVYDQMLTLDPTKISKLFSSKKIIIKAVLNTSRDNSGNQINVKFKSSYKINVRLGIAAKLKISTTF